KTQKHPSLSLRLPPDSHRRRRRRPQLRSQAPHQTDRRFFPYPPENQPVSSLVPALSPTFIHYPLFPSDLVFSFLRSDSRKKFRHLLLNHLPGLFPLRNPKIPPQPSARKSVFHFNQG